MLAVLAVLAGAALGPPVAARADQTVLSATIYPSLSASVGYRSVSLSTLASCPLFAGPNPMYLYPAQSPYQWATDSTWSVSTVLGCALGIPAGAVTTVQVRSPSQGYETLPGSELTDPASYHDPLAPAALPVISSESGEDLNTYFRPWRGGADDNARDKVTAFGAPIAIVVYEHGVPLTVAIAARRTTADAVALSATVHDPGGSAIPASSLRWSWDLGDGSTSTAPAPAHGYAVGRYIVSLNVADPGAGTGGTATTTVTVGGNAETGRRQPGGGGRSSSGPPSGPAHSHGGHPGGPAGSASGAGSQTAGRHRHAVTTARGKPSAGAAGTATAPSPSGGGTAAPPPRTASAPRRRAPAARGPAPRTASRASLVSGRLISYVTPLAPGASPLTHLVAAAVAAAPAARQAASASPLPGLAAALAIVLLFGLGAGREWRGRRGRFRVRA